MLRAKRRATYNLLRGGERSNDFSNLESQLLGQVRLLGARAVELWLHRDEGIHGLSGDVIRSADHSGLGDSLVENQGRLDLGS